MIRFEHRNLLSNPYLKTAIPSSRLVDFAGMVKSAREEILSDRKADILGFYDLPEQDTTRITDFVDSLDPKFENMVCASFSKPRVAAEMWASYRKECAR